MLRSLVAVILACALPCARAAAAPDVPTSLAPAVAVEAEEFQIDRGFRVVRNGEGNYMVDIIGGQHISGERLLCADGTDAKAAAHADVIVPVRGDYRLWVRYEYPTDAEARFRVSVTQKGRERGAAIMGRADSPRYSFGATRVEPQYDPPWGSEGLAEEVLDVRGLEAGPARIRLATVPQPQKPGVSAGRHIDLVYLTSDSRDAWRARYPNNRLYPILDAFRDTRGARWELQIANRGDAAADYHIDYPYNRVPWSVPPEPPVEKLAPRADSAWIPLAGQDTAHFSMLKITGSPKQAYRVRLRPVGKKAVSEFDATEPEFGVYLPPYSRYGEVPIARMATLDAVLALLGRTPAPGRAPTSPLCFGGWIPIGRDDELGRKYAALYAAIGMRSLHSTFGDLKVAIANLAAVGVAATRSLTMSKYRLPPTAANVAALDKEVTAAGVKQYLSGYDYGDEIPFSEWLDLMLKEAGGGAPTALFGPLFRAWLDRRQPGYVQSDYLLPSSTILHPDSSAAAARYRPRLYVDSLRFYEESAIAFVAEGRNRVKAKFGDDVLAGANWGIHPFYDPGVAQYVKWFRGGAADLGRHSEYFWQAGQPGPMVDGYVAEHLRSGMRDDPRAIIRQYVMPHVPGNTDGNFLRTAYTMLAHGARQLDFFGIGLNETFTENHIDHRHPERYLAIRDVTHSIGLVEDVLPTSTVAPSRVALLVSDSTERWDFAAVAGDLAKRAVWEPGFRNVRLSFHLERVGLYYALTLLGLGPDIVIEEDLDVEHMKDYRVLYVVGDSLPAAAAPALAKWVEAGGVLFAVAATGRFDSYRQLDPQMEALLGIAARTVDERARFIRPRQELPQLEPIAVAAGTLDGKPFRLPQLAIRERIAEAPEASVLARFEDDQQPAVITLPRGKGKIYYTATLPGLAYLYAALRPAAVPDRGPNVHRIPTRFDAGARALIAEPLRAAALAPPITSDGNLLDMRLLRGATSDILPIANYNEVVGGKVTISMELAPGILVQKVTTAHAGAQPFKQEGSRLEFTIPKLGYGDIVRIDR